MHREQAPWRRLGIPQFVKYDMCNVGNFRWSIDERKPTEVRVGFISIFISKFYTFIARENSVGPCILFLSHFNEEVSWYS